MARYNDSASTPQQPSAALPTICIAVQGSSADDLFARAEQALADSSFLEIRLDSLTRPVDGLARLRQFVQAHPEAQLIATCRRRPNGGAFDGSLPEELAILHRAAESGACIVDLELESAEEAGPEAVELFRTAIRHTQARLLVSFHDFGSTTNLDQAAVRIAAFHPEIEKVVSTATCLADNLAVLSLIHRRMAAGAHIVAIAMGEQGLPSRVLATARGADFSFAAAGSGVETAPGQLTPSTLRQLYGFDSLNAQTKIFGVAGNPIHHSMSPRMHNAAYRATALDAVMLPLLARSSDDLLALARQLPIQGLAVTMPLKLEVLPFLAHKDPLVERIGACNTLRLEPDGSFSGFNTDADGILRPLQKRIQLQGARIAILGAGGAARAAIFSLVDAGAEVFVVNRTHQTAVNIASEAGAQALPHAELKSQRFDVLLNSTPCGMKGSTQPMPIAPDELNASLVFDMVYNPLETPLIQMAKSRGLQTISGIEMFVQQGSRQFELWTGQPAPENAMRQIVEQELRRQG